MYGFRATKNGIKYVAENGKVLVEQAVKGLQNAYVGAVNLVEQTGQDLAEFQKNVQILVARGVIKSFELQKNATGALINGTAYGAKVAL
ncbi:MAG: hypothetical protein LBG59_03695 [Candidatus Peribacteria bacterium]|nr:hypothetical protein [Candidatus Peribacteria bacterium]